MFEEGIKVSATGGMATRQPILELPCWSDNKESQQLRVYYLRECRKANLPREIDITIYCTKISPLLEYASPVWGSLSKYLAKELQSIQNRYLDVIGIPKTSLPTLEDRCLATKRELERIVNDVNHQNQILLTKCFQRFITTPSKPKVKVQNITMRTQKIIQQSSDQFYAIGTR